MNRKLLSISLTLALALSILIPLASVKGAGTIPNPNHFYRLEFGGPENIDPQWTYDTASGQIEQNIYDSLCAFDGISTDAYIAKVADDWPGYGSTGNVMVPSSPDPAAPVGTFETWYFHIKENVPWHDGAYGTVTPADVEYTVERGMRMDHSGGPMWMFYEPLLGLYAAMDFDADENGTLEEAEYLTLEAAIDAAVESNSTHVWFNLPAGYAPFQQILCQSWAMILCKEYAATHGCWTGQYNNYTEFQRCFDPPSPSPLMTPTVEAMGCGPFKLAAINTDPNVGWYVLERFVNYHLGWGANYVDYVTVKNIAEWANRKAQFFSTDPAMQGDSCVVPRANCPEMHPGGNIAGDPYPGFRCVRIPIQSVACTFFNYNITTPSDWMCKLGVNDMPTLLRDRDMRLAIGYCMNSTQFLAEYWLGEAILPPCTLPEGTAFYNDSKPRRNIDITKATAHFQAAHGGQVWAQGFKLILTYNTGNTARQTVCNQLRDIILHRIAWPGSITVTVDVVGVPWATYIPAMNGGRLPCFQLGWLADFPDPHNWFMPFMHSQGDYGKAIHIEYGLGDISNDWYAGASYPAPPYTNALGGYVTAINNTYVNGMISSAVSITNPTIREAIYNELMDIQYAEFGMMPTSQSFSRNYMRTWAQGFEGTWNENPINPGQDFYTQYKSTAATVYTMDISSAATIANTTEAYPVIQVWHGGMMLKGEPAVINYSLSVTYTTGSGTAAAYVYVGFLRNETSTPYWVFPQEFYVTLIPGQTFNGDVSWYEDEDTRDLMSTGNWTICLYASPSSTDIGDPVEDTDLANNLNPSPYLVEAKELVGDIRPDGEVNILDAIRLGNSFGLKDGDDGYNPDANLKTIDDEINILDAIVLGNYFGKTVP